MTGECNNSLAEGLRSMDVYMYVWDCSLLVCMENLLFVMYRQKNTATTTTVNNSYNPMKKVIMKK